MKRTFYLLPALLVWGLLAVSRLEAQDAANSSQRDQLQQLTVRLPQSPGDQALREKIINLANAMNPPPAPPEEAERRMVRGLAAFKEAKAVSDYKDAVVEFEKATLAAPWYANAYYNLGQARAKTEDYAGAAASLELYLLAAPGAKDAAGAKTLMYEMEYKQEKADKERSAAQANAQLLAQAQRLADAFRGTWYGADCYVGEMSLASLKRGCTVAETKRRNWGDFRDADLAPVALEFEIENDGTVKMNEMSVWAGCAGRVFGIPQGAAFSDIRWEVRPKDGPARQIWSDINNDGRALWISCTRPVSGIDATIPYAYVLWKRTP
jgi:tetratricopeptide (TPR) repeat protein